MLNQISDYELMDMYWTQHLSMHMKERHKEKRASKC